MISLIFLLFLSSVSFPFLPSFPFYSLLPLFFGYQDSLEFRARRAAYVLLYASAELGYFISQPKSNLLPVQRMVHLGLGIDARLMAYFLTDRIRAKFRVKRDELLSSGFSSEKQMQSFLGKCNHLRSVFPGSALFTFHCRKLVSSLGVVPSPLPPAVVSELQFWSFVDSQTDPVPFRLHRHLRLFLSTDASGYAYGAEVSLPSGPLVMRDYWRSELLSCDISVKEALAVFFVLQALPESIFSRRVDVQVDNEGLCHAWSGLKASSQGLVDVLRELFLLCVDLKVDLRLHWVPSSLNPADAPSRALSRSDASLTDRLRVLVWDWCGPLSWDLMALPSNVFCLPGSRPLPFFSPFPVSGAAGVDVFSQNAPSGVLYAFPPFVMISALVGLLAEWGDVCAVLILPVGHPSSSVWLSRLSPYVLGRLCLASPSDLGVLCLPSRCGFRPNGLPLRFGLAAFRCYFPPCGPVSSPLPPPSVRVLVVADSVFRPISDLVWPWPFVVRVICLSGQRLRAVLLRCLEVLSSSSFDVCLFHGGINDVSKGGDGFEAGLRESCLVAAEGFPSVFPGGSVLCSSVCQSRSSVLNVRVSQANSILRSFSTSCGWVYVSHDNVRFSDLHDDVHLNASGIAKLYRHVVFALRSLDNSAS